MSNEFAEIAETIGYDNFTAEIIDGKMVITPADAGIMLFAYISTNETALEDCQSMIDELRADYNELRLDNSLLRDLLDRCYGVLIDAGHVTLAEMVIDAAYPVKGITEYDDDNDGDDFDDIDDEED